MKDELRRILIEFKEKGIPKDLIKRDLNLRLMENKANVFTGIRRAGKTYLLYQQALKFNFRDVFYINMEDDRLINPGIQHLTELIPLIKETFETGEKIYLFVDEIQRIDDWARWARRIAESTDTMLFISGSSSKLTSSEIPTVLRGRSLTNYVSILNFEEFLKFKRFDYNKKTIHISPKKPQLLRLLNEYLLYGGFPEIVLTNDKRRKVDLIKDYFSTIVAKDIIERYNIDNILALETFMKYLINNYSRYISFSKTQKWMNSIGIKVGKSTLIEYYKYITQSFFINQTSIFSYKIKDILQYPIKVYITDTGFINALSLKQQNKGWIYEQIVANELFKKANTDHSIEISYWKVKESEIDFVVKKGLTIKQLIQVCYDIDNFETGRREIKALLKAGKELRCNTLLIINEDKETEEKIDGKKIKYIPLWKWLLS